MLTFGSLFAGIGGFDLGLERAGMKCLWQVESDPYCLRVLSRHWPNVARFTDVHKFCRRIHDCDPEDEAGEVRCPLCGIEFGECECVGSDQLTDEHGWPDMLVGGDPCQGNSNAKTHGRTAAVLAPEYLRIVDQLHPRYVLREHPATLRAGATWPGFRFANALECLGYVARPFRFKACCAGADHRRDRMFVFAVNAHANRQGLEGNECEVVARTVEGRQDADAARPDRWHTSPRICRGSDGIPNRMDRLRTLGNAVVPQVAEFIGRAIVAAHAGSEQT